MFSRRRYLLLQLPLRTRHSRTWFMQHIAATAATTITITTVTIITVTINATATATATAVIAVVKERRRPKETGFVTEVQELPFAVVVDNTVAVRGRVVAIHCAGISHGVIGPPHVDADTHQ